MFHKLSTKCSVQMARICVWDHRKLFCALLWIPTSQVYVLFLIIIMFRILWLCSMVNSCKLDFQTYRHCRSQIMISWSFWLHCIVFRSSSGNWTHFSEAFLFISYGLLSEIMTHNLGFQKCVWSNDSTEFEFEAIICSLKCVDKVSDPLQYQSAALAPRKSNA